MDEEDSYSLKGSTGEVGALYPVLISKDDEIIDGFHRLEQNQDWPVMKLEHIQTRTQLLLARLIANFARRTISPQEKTNMLASIAEETKWTPREISKKTGIHYKTVCLYLPDKYKDSHMQAVREKREAVRRKDRSVNKLLTSKEASEPEIKIVYDPKADDRERYLEGLNMWFMSAGDPVLLSLRKYCMTKEVHWADAVKAILADFLRKQGFLEE